MYKRNDNQGRKPGLGLLNRRKTLAAGVVLVTAVSLGAAAAAEELGCQSFAWPTWKSTRLNWMASRPRSKRRWRFRSEWNRECWRLRRRREGQPGQAEVLRDV